MQKFQHLSHNHFHRRLTLFPLTFFMHSLEQSIRSLTPDRWNLSTSRNEEAALCHLRFGVRFTENASHSIQALIKLRDPLNDIPGIS